MKYVLLKAKPYTRTRKGKLEQVKGYQSRLRSHFPPAALEEATVHQIAKDYLVTKDEARQMYRDMFGPEREQTFIRYKNTGKLWHGKPVYDIRKIDKENFSPMVHTLMDQGRMRGYVQVFVDVVGGKEWVNVRESELTDKADEGVFASSTPKIGDTVVWKRHSALGKPPDRTMTVVGFDTNQKLVILRDAGATQRHEFSGPDLYVPLKDVKITSSDVERTIVPETVRAVDWKENLESKENIDALRKEYKKEKDPTRKSELRHKVNAAVDEYNKKIGRIERTVVPETVKVVRPFRDANKLKALSYVKNLKNPHKKDYAYSYFQFLMDGGTGNPPENPNIGAMGKQAVRMKLDEILNKSFLQDAMKIINATPFTSKKARYDDIKMVLDVIKQEEDYDGENRGDDSKDSKEFHSDVFEAEDELINFIQSELGEEGVEGEPKEGDKGETEEGEEGLEEGLELPEGAEEPPVPPAIGYKNKKEENPKKKEEEVKKSGGKCPFDGKQGVYLRRFYQSPYWMREYKCPKGHVFTEVQ